jgi:isoleucyl-tRNA synthetase
VDELSNWYVRRCRERYWGPGMPRDKVNAYLVLHHVLVTTAKAAAPFVPFMTELMYQNLVSNLSAEEEKTSIHLCDFPLPVPRFDDPALEKDMATVLDIVTLGRAARNAANCKNRQPLPEMLVSLGGESGKDLPESFLAIIKDELNVKNIRFTDAASASQYTGHRFKPQLRTLGPRYGKLVPKITEALNQDENAMQSLERGAWNQNIEGTDVSLTLEDVLVETVQKEGFSAQSERNLTVVLDIRLTPELIEEGHMRELVSKYQTMRKEAGFNVTDRIQAGYGGNETLAGVIGRNETAIRAEILADGIIKENAPERAYVKEWNINGESVTLWVMRI